MSLPSIYFPLGFLCVPDFVLHVEVLPDLFGGVFFSFSLVSLRGHGFRVVSDCEFLRIPFEEVLQLATDELFVRFIGRFCCEAELISYLIVNLAIDLKCFTILKLKIWFLRYDETD